MNPDVLSLQGATGKYARFKRTPDLDRTVDRVKSLVRKCEPAVFHLIRGGEPLFAFTDAQPGAAAAMLYQLPPPGETLLRLNAFIVHKFLRVKGGGPLFWVTDNEGGALLVRFPRLADDQTLRSVAAEISETPLTILVISGPDNTVADAACRFATMARQGARRGRAVRGGARRARPHRQAVGAAASACAPDVRRRAVAQ
jgi:hypothetical protein